MAYDIIDRLELYGKEDVLSFLAESVSERERKKGQLHKVFAEIVPPGSSFADLAKMVITRLQPR